MASSSLLKIVSEQTLRCVHVVVAHLDVVVPSHTHIIPPLGTRTVHKSSLRCVRTFSHIWIGTQLMEGVYLYCKHRGLDDQYT